MTATKAAVPNWLNRAACADVDPDIFYVGRGQSTDAARAICARCPVARECDEYGGSNRYGVWGGMASLERRPITRRANNG